MIVRNNFGRWPLRVDFSFYYSMWILRNVNFVGFQIRCNLFGLNFEKGVTTVQNYDFMFIELIFLNWCNRPCRYCVIILWQEIPPSQRYSKRGFLNRVSCLCDLRYYYLVNKSLIWERTYCVEEILLDVWNINVIAESQISCLIIEWITDLQMTLEWYWILLIFNVCGWFSCDLSERCERD